MSNLIKVETTRKVGKYQITAKGNVPKEQALVIKHKKV